jgi:carbon monoxide dehydrogenase subunit G
VTEVCVTAEFDVPSERLWQIVADFGNVSWIPGMTDVRVEGRGPGMTRFLPAGESEIHEHLESIDEQGRSLVYTIPKNLPFAADNYRATMKVEDSGSGCRLIWSCTLEPRGVSEDEVKETVRGMYDMMIGWIRDYLKHA